LYNLKYEGLFYMIIGLVKQSLATFAAGKFLDFF